MNITVILGFWWFLLTVYCTLSELTWWTSGQHEACICERGGARLFQAQVKMRTLSENERKKMPYLESLWSVGGSPVKQHGGREWAGRWWRLVMASSSLAKWVNQRNWWACFKECWELVTWVFMRSRIHFRRQNDQVKFSSLCILWIISKCSTGDSSCPHLHLHRKLKLDKYKWDRKKQKSLHIFFPGWYMFPQVWIKWGFSLIHIGS